MFFSVPFNIHMRTGVISVAKEIDDNELLAYTVKVIFTFFNTRTKRSGFQIFKYNITNLK